MSGAEERLREMELDLPARRSAGQYVGAVRSLGLSEPDHRELQRLRIERQNDYARTALTA